MVPPIREEGDKGVEVNSRPRFVIGYMVLVAGKLSSQGMLGSHVTDLLIEVLLCLSIRA